MSEEGYNGWKNYPTWCVNLWLSNDEGLYNATLDVAREGMRLDEAQGTKRVAVADAIRDWVKNELPVLIRAHWGEGYNRLGDSGMYADLLGYALDSVDWFEIADAWIEMASES